MVEPTNQYPARKSCRKILRKNVVGNSCRKMLWEILAGSCRKFLWESLAGNCCGKFHKIFPQDLKSLQEIVPTRFPADVVPQDFPCGTKSCGISLQEIFPQDFLVGQDFAHKILRKSCLGKNLPAKSCGKILREILRENLTGNLVGKSCARFPGNLAGKSHAGNLAGKSCGKSCGKILREILQENLPGKDLPCKIPISKLFLKVIFKICNSSRST